MENIDVTSLVQVLIWIAAGPGSVYLVNSLVSYLVANSKKWNELPGQWKFVLMLLLAPVLAILAQIILSYQGYIELNIQPWFAIAMNSVVGYLGSQRTYSNITRSGYANLPE